ncbi:MAG: endonuclease/exonuclease/phosphatase family protein [Cellvibrionaceae bacterium]
MFRTESKSTKKDDRFRVLSYNIHKGFTRNNKNFVLDEIRQAIRSVDAELVFLQEVLGNHENHGLKHSNWIPEAQFEYLADSMWPHFAYGKNAIYQHGHHGNAILCKKPFSQWENTDVSQYKFSQRGILHGTIDNKLHVICMHLGLLGSERRHQVQSLVDMVKHKVPKDAPLIIAGDFNDWKCTLDKKMANLLGVKEAFREFKGSPARTFPSNLPMLQLDRIYYRNVKLWDAKRLSDPHWRTLSDHCPLFAEFSID